MTEEIFHECLTNVFVPYIQHFRENPDFAELCVLLMDSVAGRVSERNLRLLGENRIIALVFPANTTDLFQAFDFGLSAAMKNNKDSLGNEPEFASAHGHI
jgi:hypothetical protein